MSSYIATAGGAQKVVADLCCVCLAKYEQGRVLAPSDQAVPCELQGMHLREMCATAIFRDEDAFNKGRVWCFAGGHEYLHRALPRPCFSDVHVCCWFVKEHYDAKVIHFDITSRVAVRVLLLTEKTVSCA